MIQTKFAIVDIETTGGIARRDKITEIGIIVFQNGEVLDKFTTLIDPERSIPVEITRITGITNEMVASAPKFYEVAKEIIIRLQDCVFVAHNVHFDYNFIREEFSQLGYHFNSKKLCTLQLSRRQFKGLRSYSLGSLIQHFDIVVNARHRAMDDCLATLELFKKILHEQSAESLNHKTWLPNVLKETKFPPSISLDAIENLPEETGVYFMLNQSFQAIYIGKSKNIRERILQHFNTTGTKVQKMLSNVHYLDYQLTGSELMASLLEAELIKKHQPEINRALRKKSHSFLLTVKKEPHLYNRFEINEAEWIDSQDEVIHHYASRAAAKQHVDYLILQYQLCQQINSNKSSDYPCTAHSIGQCHGACINREDHISYNARFQAACEEVRSIFKEDFILLTQGLHANDKAVIVIEHGFCRYLGYVDNQQAWTSFDELKLHLRNYEGNVETNRIIQLYMKRDKKLVILSSEKLKPFQQPACMQGDSTSF